VKDGKVRERGREGEGKGRRGREWDRRLYPQCSRQTRINEFESCKLKKFIRQYPK
jgi:hypothetical protein